jgi:hypothetical protein
VTAQAYTIGTNRQKSGLTTSFVLSTIVASIIHVLILLRGFYSATFDESGRTLDAYNWIRGSEPFTTVWLPFYKLVVGGTLLLAPDLFVTPRIVSYVFSIASLCTLIWFSHVLFKNQTTTLLTGLIGALFPPRVILGIVPLAEIMFMVAVTVGLAFLAQWFSSGRNRYVFLSAISLAIASSIRYEGWVFVVVFIAAVLFLSISNPNGRNVSSRTTFSLFLISSSFMMLWVVLHFIQHGRALGFVSDTTGRYALIHGDSFALLLSNNPLTQFGLQNLWTLNIIGVLSLRAFTRRNIHNSALILIPIFSLLIVSSIALWGKGMPTHAFWRIPALWSVLLIPFTAHWFATQFLHRKHSAILTRVGLIVLLLAMLALCMRGIFSMTEHSAFSANDLASGHFVNEQLLKQVPPGSQKVLIESGIWSYINVMVASQHPELFVLNSGFDPVAHEEPLLNPDKPFDASGLQQLGLGLLVFRREDYKDYLESSTEIRKLQDFGPWTIYAFVSQQASFPSQRK